MSKLIKIIFLFVSCAITCAQTIALPEDKTQPIAIKSDGKLHINTQKNIVTYTKNVVVRQGSLKINADELSAHGNIDNWNRIIATGTPAKLEQQPSSDEQIVKVSGNRIEYMVDSEKIKISGNVKLEQGCTLIEAASLFYDVNNSSIDAEAGSDGIRMTIPPKNANTGASCNGNEN